VLHRLICGGLAVVLVAACGGEPVDPGPLVPVASVSLDPADPVVGVGATAPLTAVARSADGTALVNRTIAFSSGDPAIASVDGSGVVTGVAVGSTAITATSEGRSRSVTLTVSNVAVSSVAVAPTTAALKVGAELTLTGQAFDAGAAPLPNRVFAWSSSSPAVATVSPLGVVRGLTAGTTTITGTSEGQSATAEITVVVPPVATVEVTPAAGSLGIGDSLQLSATLEDADGDPITDRAVTWETSNELVATVSATGRVRGVSPGPVTITARAEGVSGQAALTVTLRFSSVSAGVDFSCGVTPLGTAYCWGRNTNGSLGNGTVVNSTTPVAVTMPAGVRFDSVSAGGDHACGLSRDGAIYCWGSNASGQLGTGDVASRTTPAQVIAPLGAPSVRYTNVAAGVQFTCARATSELAYCWGLNFDGQLGNAQNAGLSQPNSRPLEVLGGPFDVVTAFRGHTCALTTDFGVCWGSNTTGQLGRGGATDPGDFVPALISGSRRFSAIAAGGGHTCAVGLLDRAAFCWGDNEKGQLGTTLGGGAVLATFPVEVSGSRTFVSISAGDDLTCAVTTSGGGFCWGSNQFGQLGIDSQTEQPTPALPRAVAGNLLFRSIDVGAAHACGVTTDNRAYCWGRANDGLVLNANALGTGDPASVRTPAPVSGQ
jgi:alpha-tubulin suppressor-like RCC1 family protein